MLITLNVPFKKMALNNGENITLSVSPDALNALLQQLTATNVLTTEELTALVIGQLELCDRNNLSHVLPETVWEKLNSTYESVKNGE